MVDRGAGKLVTDDGVDQLNGHARLNVRPLGNLYGRISSPCLNASIWNSRPT
jgi:hypothetical protein